MPIANIPTTGLGITSVHFDRLEHQANIAEAARVLSDLTVQLHARANGRDNRGSDVFLEALSPRLAALVLQGAGLLPAGNAHIELAKAHLSISDLPRRGEYSDGIKRLIAPPSSPFAGLVFDLMRADHPAKMAIVVHR